MVEKTATCLVCLFLLFLSPCYAHGAMEFDLDFGQDGTVEESWRMQTGESVFVDVYVSNVPGPGLISMGFIIEYDPIKLGIVAGEDQTVVDEAWNLSADVHLSSGQVEMIGARLGGGLAGDLIRLGQVKFRCLQSGTSDLTLLDRDEGSDDFVLADQSVLDGDIPSEGVLLATVYPPHGDIDGDGTVDLTDAIMALRIMVGLDPAGVDMRGDVNKDGKIGVAETIYVLQEVANLRN